MDYQLTANKFLDKLFKNLQQNKINLKKWEIDHLCYRTSSHENYEEIKSFFQSHGNCLIESNVNGRMIATYKLNNPIHYKDYIIDLIEVPAPKLHKETKEGFEHIEVVIDEDFNTFMSHYPALQFVTKGLSKGLNPELEIEYEDCAIKFHHKSLEHIINIEKNQSLMNFLEESQILSHFKENNPCLSGTPPLGIEVEDSDIDILFVSESLENLSQSIESYFGKYQGYSSSFGEHQGQQSLVVNFNHKDLPVEIFAQKRGVFKQQANQHFLIEGRLLKILGTKFKQEIINLKKSGLKTEPAFGKILGLENPYQELLHLSKLSDRELLEKFS